MYVALVTNQIKTFGQKSNETWRIVDKYSVKNKTNLNIPNETAEIANFHYSDYKSMETASCHSNEKSSWTVTMKNITYVEGNVLSMYAKFQLHPPFRC